MTMEHIGHQHIVNFADEYVNLTRDNAKKYREQVNRLRAALESKIAGDPDFELKRMLLSGSLAKGTALKSLNDIDVALYILQDNAPQEMPEFIAWLVDTLRGLFPNMAPSKITPQQHSVCISFRGTGLDVDIVPISYDGNQDWDGYLYSTTTGKWLMTNIVKHLEFIRKRKSEGPDHYAQVIRLLKYWVKEIKKGDDDFKFKSFLVELIMAHLADKNAIQLGNYVEALADFFNFIVRGGLNNVIVFQDYYSSGRASDGADAIRVFDPVNPKNNVAQGYTRNDKQRMVDAASEAADAVDSALYATTKGETVRHWQKIFGSSFGG